MRFQCGVKKWKIAISSNIKSGSRSIFRICQSVTQSVSHSFSFRHSVRLNSSECIFSAAAASLPPWLPACLLHSLTVSQSVSPELSTYIRPRPFLRPPAAIFPPPSAVALQWTFSWTLLCCCRLSVRHLHSSYPVTHPDARPPAHHFVDILNKLWSVLGLLMSPSVRPGFRPCPAESFIYATIRRSIPRCQI